MEQIFKCDCGTHIVQFEYTKPSKDCDFEDFSVVIYDVYNPETGRKYHTPKDIGDVVLMNNKYQELDKFFKFMKEVIKERKLPTKEYVNHLPSDEEELDKAIAKVRELNEKISKKFEDEKRKKKNDDM